MDGGVVGSSSGERGAEFVLDFGTLELGAVLEVAFEVVDQLHGLLGHLEAQAGVDLGVGPREVPEVARRALGGLEDERVVPLDGFLDVNDLAVGRTEVAVVDVRVERGV